MKRHILSKVIAPLVTMGLATFAIVGCDKDTSSSKTTTTKTTQTPEGTKKTTETTEKKIETEHKDPR